MNRLHAERTLSPESPLLDGEDVTDPLTPRSNTSLLDEQPRKAPSIWQRISLTSILFNLTILTALIYGSGVCINTIQDSLKPHNELCMNSVSTSYNYLTFSGAGYGSWAGPKCRNHNRIISTYASGKTFCTDSEIDAGFEKIRRECAQHDIEYPDWKEIIANVTDEDIHGMRVIEFEEVSRTENITESVLLSRSFFKRVDATLTTWEYEVHWHHRSGFVLYAFWAIVLAIAAINHMINTVRTPAAYDDSASISGIMGFVQSSNRWIKTNLNVPPMIGSHHQRLFFWCTIPTRMETIIVASFYLLATYLCIAHYRLIPNNIYWDDKSQQLWRYVADRTGIVAYATLPLIWVFAGRNNVFMWATGLSYQTFNIYHRHVARVGTVLAIVHSVVYTSLFLIYEGWVDFSKEFTQVWFAFGLIATLTMCFLLLLSVAWLRVKFYETFLILHIILSMAVLVGCFLHTSIFGHEYNAYLWPLVVIWLLDRGLRLLRLVLCNLQVKFSKNGIQGARTTASYSKESDVIRVDMTINSLLAQPGPGQFYYLYQPSTWQGYENHPFTLGAWSTCPSTPSSFSDAPLLSRSNTRSEEDDDDDETLPSDSKLRTPTESKTLTFWVRPYDGWTKRLRNECLNSPSLKTNPTLLLEGPYGHHSPLHDFENITLIAGGTGIASAIPYIQEYISLCKIRRTRTSKVRLVWTTKQEAFIHEVFARELNGVCRRKGDFECELYYTRVSGVGKDGAMETQTEVEVQQRRPDIRGVIRKAVREGRAQRVKTAVLVCGPAGMADEARVAVHRVRKEGYSEVEYFEESFGW